MAVSFDDRGYVLKKSKFGERDVVLQLFTAEHGRYAGLVKAGTARSKFPLLQIGNLLTCRWRARLSDQLGQWDVESERLMAGRLLTMKEPLLASASASDLVLAACGEREAMPVVFVALQKLYDALVHDPDWLETYIRFELVLLAEAGFALDLSKCAVTGTVDDLIWVSPKTGRAVSSDVGAAYADRLLPLPGFLAGNASFSLRDGLIGLRLSQFFLQRHIFDPLGRDLPAARYQLQASLAPS